MKKEIKMKISDVTWKLECLDEDMPIKGNALSSGDDEEDAKAEQWVLDQLRSGNEWAWCCARVTGTFEGVKETDYLGGCSYLSEEDFIKGGYYEDMKAEVLERLKLKVAAQIQLAEDLKNKVARLEE